jgi:CDP-diacylglycerol--glycerol-3-phosphate 3-phosphatidyltransferase
MSEKVSNFNKVNIITISRIFLSIIAVLLLFSGNVKFLAIAYAIMGFSEMSDVVDGYLARRDKLVTNLGKILDPLSDSVSRFFFYFAFAWHGLFPIWFMIFYFFEILSLLMYEFMQDFQE